MKRFLIPLLLLLVLSSCRSSISAELSRAETLFQQHPDSSLSCLRRIRQKQLKTKKDRARYSLWMSAALDKNYIDVTSDTLIRKAVDYYSKHGDVRHRMLAWYYEGVVLKNAKEYSAAIIAFEKAEREAISLKDYYQLGLVLRNKANVFSNTYNDNEAIASRKQAISYFSKANATSYKEFAELALAVDYSNNKQLSLADSLLSALRKETNIPVISAYCDIRRAGILIKIDKSPTIALDYYRQTPLRYYNSLDYARRALAHDRLMERDSANHWISIAYASCKNAADTISVNFIYSKILHQRGQNDTAFQIIRDVLAYEDSLTRIQLYQSVSGAQRDYYKSETERQEEQLRNARREKVLGLIIVLLLAFIGIIWFISYSREKDRQLQEQITRLALKEKEISQTTKTNAHLLGSLFSSRIEHLDQLTRAYYNTENELGKEALFKQIKQSVSSIRNNPEVFVSLEEDLNRYCNGIMSKLHCQVPRIKGNNIKIIMLYFAGFPYEVVQLIMNSQSIESLKMARTRFRKEILAANAADESLFLDMLEIKKRPQDNTNESLEGC